ncbi:MAG: PIN domain-containing protein [Micrococcales bacterium]|nr:PIN domain-containing protein [Micrococcales bacterium]MCL2666229.1 PIN domain-containing protein [Micrococcales bacterium]
MSDLDLPDVNVLVALLHPGHVHHHVAQQWFANAKRFATTAVTEAGLLRMALNPTVTGTEASTAAALASLRSLRSDARAQFLPDDSSLAHATVDLIGLMGHKQVTDLHLVNLAACHGARLVTLDKKIRLVLAPGDQACVVTLS